MMSSVVAEDRSLKRQEMTDGQNVSAGFSDLMPELLTEIAENLSSFIDYSHFRRCNKACASIGTRKNPFQPCFIYVDKDVNGAWQYYITDTNLNRRLRINNNDVRKTLILCSRGSWLLLGDQTECLTLFNPFTSQTVQIVSYKTYWKPFILGNPSTTCPENSCVLSLSPSGETNAAGNYCAEPGKAGRCVFSSPPGFLPKSGTLFRECLYIISDNGSLGRLRLCGTGGSVEPGFEWEVLEGFNRPFQYFTYPYLTECGGELVSVFTTGNGEGMRVFKMREDEKKWQEIDSLGGYSVYLDVPSSMSCMAQTWDLADRIYLPRRYDEGLRYYSMKTKEFHSITNEQFVKSDLISITWIIPEWS